MFPRYLRNLIVWAVILVVAFPLALQLWRRTPRNELPYSVFLERLQAGQVVEVDIGDGSIDGQLRSGERFVTYVPQGDYSYLDLLKAKGVLIRAEPRARSSLWPSLLSTLLPILLLVGLWMLMLRQAQSGGPLTRRAAWPIVREIVAGSMIMAPQNIEGYLTIPPDLAKDDGFVLRIKDDSLIEEGILVGDLLIVRRQETANDGDLVVARAGTDATVRRFYREGTRVRLQPANRTMPPIVAGDRDVVIGGKAVGVFRRFT